LLPPKHGVGLGKSFSSLTCAHALVHDLELVEQAVRLRIVEEPLPGKSAIFVDGIDRAMRKLFGQTVADLVDLIPRQGLFSSEVIGILFFHPPASDPGFDRDLGGTKLL